MNFKSTFDLAIYMLKQRIYDEDDEDNFDKKLIKTIRAFRKKLDKDIGISFTSCNYDTYIAKIAGLYVVSTCNNTNWELDDFSVYQPTYPEELKSLGIEDRESLELFYKHYDFWYPQFHLIGRAYEEENYTFKTCPHHKNQYNFIVVKNPKVLQDNEYTCPICYKQNYEIMKLLMLEEYDL